MSTLPNPLAQLRQAERTLLVEVLNSAETINVVGTTVMEAVLKRHRMATDAALQRIAGCMEEVQEMAQEVTDAFVATANSLRGDVSKNETPDLPGLMGPAQQEPSDQAALPGPTSDEQKAQPSAIVPRKSRKPKTPPPPPPESTNGTGHS